MAIFDTQLLLIDLTVDWPAHTTKLSSIDLVKPYALGCSCRYIRIVKYLGDIPSRSSATMYVQV